MEWSSPLLPAVAEIQPASATVSEAESSDEERATRIPVTRWVPEKPEARAEPDAQTVAWPEQDWVRRAYGRQAERQAAAAPRRRGLFRPMGLQRFGGVAGALATCAIMGMGFMRWLDAQPKAASAPRVLARVVVITPGTTVHSRKGIEHPVIKTTRRGECLSVVDKTDGWWKVIFPNGLTGWIERRDTAVIIPEPTRLAPGASASVVAASGTDG
jgi:hypothetical protein